MVKIISSQNKQYMFTISSSVFGKIGGLEFLIKCDFELSKLPLKLSLFHQQVLL